VRVINRCSITNCLEQAVQEERGESEHWQFVIHYCHEHARQLNLGTPLGPAGLDASKLDVVPKGVKEPATGGRMPGIA
jgi:hypothetical protein